MAETKNMLILQSRRLAQSVSDCQSGLSISLRQRSPSGLQAADGPSVQIGLRRDLGHAEPEVSTKPVSRKLVALELELCSKFLGSGANANFDEQLADGRPCDGQSDGAVLGGSGRVAGTRGRSPEPPLTPSPDSPDVPAPACVP